MADVIVFGFLLGFVFGPFIAAAVYGVFFEDWDQE